MKESKEKKAQRAEMKKKEEERRKKKKIKSLFIVADGIRTNNLHAGQLSKKKKALLTSRSP